MKWTLRQIAKQINCSTSTVLNELRRGTPPRTGSRDRLPGYSAKRGKAIYSANRSHCYKPHKTEMHPAFMGCVVDQVKAHHWSLDACVGYARRHSLFKDDEMVCTNTLYNDLRAGKTPLSLFEMPDVLKRGHAKVKSHITKRLKGISTEQRPSVVTARAGSLRDLQRPHRARATV